MPFGPTVCNRCTNHLALTLGTFQYRLWEMVHETSNKSCQKAHLMFPLFIICQTSANFRRLQLSPATPGHFSVILQIFIVRVRVSDANSISDLSLVTSEVSQGYSQDASSEIRWNSISYFRTVTLET